MVTQGRNIRFITYTKANQKHIDMDHLMFRKGRKRKLRLRKTKGKGEELRTNPAPSTRSPLFWRLFWKSETPRVMAD